MVLCDICSQELTIETATFSFQSFLFNAENKKYKLSNPYLHHVACANKIELVVKENRVYKDIETKLNLVKSKAGFTYELHQFLSVKWFNFIEHPVTIEQVINKIYTLLDFNMYNLKMEHENNSTSVLVVGVDWGIQKDEKEKVFHTVFGSLPESIRNDVKRFKFVEFFTNLIDYEWVKEDEV